MALTYREKEFCKRFSIHFNATRAAEEAGYSKKSARAIGSENLTKHDIQAEIKNLLAEKILSDDEIKVSLSEQARANISSFFKIVEEWTFYPLPTYDIIDAKEVDILDDEGRPTGEKKISYWVRHVAIDTEKVVNPEYAKLIKKFGDSPKNGLSIELYDKQAALEFMAKLNGMVTEKIDHTSKGEKITPNEGFDRAISTLADALGEIISGQGTEQKGDVDTSE